MAWKLLEVHVVLLLGDCCGYKEAGVIRVDSASWQLFDIDGEVGKDLVQLVACCVCRMSVWDGALEASSTKFILHVRPLLVEVPGDYKLAARQLR